MRRLYEQGKSVNGAGINCSFAIQQVRYRHRYTASDTQPYTTAANASSQPDRAELLVTKVDCSSTNS